MFMFGRGNNVRLYRHRAFHEWHSGLDLTGLDSGCPDGNCTWENHRSEFSQHDPSSVHELLKLEPGARLLILSDYNQRKYVSLTTLETIFEPDGAIQLRFREASGRRWYYQPADYTGTNSHMLYLASIRFVAAIRGAEGVAPFGVDGGLDVFGQELARVGILSSAEVVEVMAKINTPAVKPTVKLKPWQNQARIMWELFEKRNYGELLKQFRYFQGFAGGSLVLAIFIAVAASFDRLGELPPIFRELEYRENVLETVEGRILRVFSEQSPEVAVLAPEWGARAKAFISRPAR